MDKIHIGLPEPILFLELAADAMGEYYKKHGTYPGEWYLLDISFANGPYRIDDLGVRPAKDIGNKWSPKGCEYSYEIASSNNVHFLIRAIKNESGTAEYEIQQGMETPRRILKTGTDRE